MKAIRIAETGGPEVMQLVDVDLPPPGPGEVRIRHTAIGLNYIDTYHRSGLYPVKLPSGLGLEAAGVVEETGEGVTHLKARRSRGLWQWPDRRLFARRATPPPTG
jgi:NADPH:quinone reductase